MGKVFVPTNFNIALELECAPFHTRMVAWLLDFVLQLFYIIISYNVFISVAGSYLGNISGFDTWALQLIILLPVFAYHFVCELLWNGQSVGKKVMSLRVVNDIGGKASPGQYLIRWLLRSSDLSIPFIILAIVFGWFGALQALGITIVMLFADLVLMATHKKSKRLGDLAGGTILVKVNPGGNLADTIFMEVAEDYSPLFPQVMRLSDGDINTIRDVLDSGRKTGYVQVVDNVAGRIKQVLGIESNMPALDFFETLLKDYNYLSTKE
ncbi:MAG TPA: RDD family protein [Agriterribacter sp.]|nr:RDD family protein [Agriterribacter sp.]